MNKTETKAYEWLKSIGKQGIIFQHTKTPDFIDNESYGYEVKLSRNNTISFSRGQLDKLLAFNNVDILVMTNNRTAPIAQIPINEIKNKTYWNNYHIKIFDDKAEKFIFSLPDELKNRLAKRAKEKGLTLTSYIRMILTEYAKLKTK